METPGTPADRRLIVQGPRLADLVEDLLWPKILRAVPLALRPGRVGIAFFALVIAFLIGTAGRLWGEERNLAGVVLERIGEGFGATGAGVLGLDPGPIAAGIGAIVAVPALAWREFGWTALLLGVPIVLVLAVAGGAISRMAACDFSQGVLLPWPRGLGFGLGRAGSVAAAVLAPVAIVALIALGLAAAGFVLLRWPGVNVVGAVLYGLMLIGGAIAVILLICWALGLPLLVPAVACEGSDGVDAIQRCYAYVLGRPHRLVIYALIAIVLGWIVTLVGWVFVEWVRGFVAWAASAWAGESGARVVSGAGEMRGTEAAAANIIALWNAVPALLLGAFVVSYFFCASTVVYLLVRQVNDGQDWAELWMPGMVEGTMAESLRARAAASGLAPDPGAARRIGVTAEEPPEERADA